MVHTFPARTGEGEWHEGMRDSHLPAYSDPDATRSSHHPCPQPGNKCRDLAELRNV